MAILDRSSGSIVIRVVYDGPPLSGKTTSVRALARTLANRHHAEVYSPQEIFGRTQFFDWLEFTGGLMSGFAVRCQIISVPGQEELAQRRAFLLRDADAVISVMDTTAAGLPISLQYFERLTPYLERPGELPVGVIVQANMRDRPEAVPIDQVRRALPALPGLAVFESVAPEATGVRESFIFAVRLALDRTRHLLQEGLLPEGKPEFGTGEELLRRLHDEEAVGALGELVRERLGAEPAAEPPPAAASSAPAEPVAEAPGPPLPTELPPPLPDATVPSGHVWPPVVGRVFLRELGAASVELAGSAPLWAMATQDGWLGRSSAQEVFPSGDEARRELLRRAREHARLQAVLSERRVITINEEAADRWRLWTFVHTEPETRLVVDRFVRAETAGALAQALVELSISASTALAAFRPFPALQGWRLAELGHYRGRPIFLGWLDLDATATAPEPTVADLVLPEVEARIRAGQLDPRRLQEAIGQLVGASGLEAELARQLTRLL
jgi:signal recognition particle receptor subunit beta